MSQLYIRLTVHFKHEGDVWTAKCTELGTATFGDTLEEARDSIQEAVCLHLNTLEDVRETSRFFEENGIKVITRKPSRVDIRVSSEDYNTFIQPIFQPLDHSFHAICRQS